MNRMQLIPSILLAASVFLLVYYGRETLARLITRMVRKDRDRYIEWARDLFLDWTPDQLRRAAYAAKAAIPVAAFLVFLLTNSVVFAAAIAVAVSFAPRIAYRFARQRRIDQLDEQLPDAVDVMVASVRAGRSLRQAIEDVAAKAPGPAGQELGLVARECQLGGMSLEEALARAKQRVPLESFTLISSALLINLARGGDLLSILERMSEALRELIRLKRKIATETAEVRAQEKIILCATPLFGAMVCSFDPDIPRILFQTIPGNLLLVVVVGLQAISLYWIRRILKSTI